MCGVQLAGIGEQSLQLGGSFGGIGAEAEDAVQVVAILASQLGEQGEAPLDMVELLGIAVEVGRHTGNFCRQVGNQRCRLRTEVRQRLERWIGLGRDAEIANRLVERSGGSFLSDRSVCCRQPLPQRLGVSEPGRQSPQIHIVAAAEPGFRNLRGLELDDISLTLEGALVTAELVDLGFDCSERRPGFPVGVEPLGTRDIEGTVDQGPYRRGLSEGVAVVLTDDVDERCELLCDGSCGHHLPVDVGA